jgi:hypothetical protein
VHRGVLAEVSLQTHGPEVCVPLVQPLERLPRLVGGAVVHEDDLVGLPEALEGGNGLAIDLLDRLFLVEDRDDE